MLHTLFESIGASLQNQFLSGGIVLMLTGSILALCRQVPSRLWRSLTSRLIVSVDVSNDDPIFEWLSLWLAAHPYSRRARRLTAAAARNNYGNIDYIQSDEGGAEMPRIIFSPAPGNHIFFYKRRIVWLSRDREQAPPVSAGGSFSMRKHEVFNIRVLGHNQRIVRELIEDAQRSSARSRETRIEVFCSIQNYWSRVDTKEPRAVSTIFLPGNTAEEIITDAERFMGNRAWYRERGIPYRRGYLLYGIPGSGKTSLILAIAGRLRRNLYVLNVSDEDLTDGRLTELLNSVPPGCLVLLEDIDAAFNRREKSGSAKSGVTFSGLLNALDGAASKEGRLLFMTTNHLEYLDPALIRPGRADVHICFDYATGEQGAKMFKAFYPQATAEQVHAFAVWVEGQALSMAQVQQHLLNHQHSPESIVNRLSLPDYEHTRQKHLA